MSTTPSPTPLFKEEIRLDLIFSILQQQWKKIILTVLVIGSISAALIVCIPRTFTSSVMLAPEYNGQNANLGNIGSLASSFGLNLGNVNSEDAITPSFYPDLMESTAFLTPLLNIMVQTKDGTFKGTYKEYLLHHQKAPFWSKLFDFLSSKEEGGIKKEINPYNLTKAESNLLQDVSDNIECTVDKKNDIITLSCTDQDPFVATIIADSTMAHLQSFITDYRTRKARTDLSNIRGLLERSYKDYKSKQRKYASFVDGHNELALQSMLTQQEELENEMQTAYNTYNTLQQRKQIAEAKVQERTPVFTTIQNATVPIKPSGPKRMIIVLSVAFLTFIVSSFYFIARRVG